MLATNVLGTEAGGSTCLHGFVEYQSLLVDRDTARDTRYAVSDENKLDGVSVIHVMKVLSYVHMPR